MYGISSTRRLVLCRCISSLASSLLLVLLLALVTLLPSCCCAIGCVLGMADTLFIVIFGVSLLSTTQQVEEEGFELGRQQ
jgi:hypothetical protein